MQTIRIRFQLFTHNSINSIIIELSCRNNHSMYVLTVPDVSTFSNLVERWFFMKSTSLRGMRFSMGQWQLFVHWQEQMYTSKSYSAIWASKYYSNFGFVKLFFSLLIISIYLENFFITYEAVYVGIDARNHISKTRFIVSAIARVFVEFIVKLVTININKRRQLGVWHNNW